MPIQNIAKTIYQDFNKRSFETNAKNYISDDYVGIDVPTGQESRGLEGYLQGSRSWVGAFPDGELEVVKQQVSGNKVTTTFRGRGTFTGQLQTPQGVVPGNGRKSDVEFRNELEFQNDKVIRGRLEYDLKDMLLQLGLEAPTV